MAQAKRRRKLKVLSRALVRKLAREWAADFRERVENFIPKRGKHAARAAKPRRAVTREPTTSKRRKPQSELPMLIPLTAREAKERKVQKKMAELEVLRIRAWIAHAELEKVKAEIRQVAPATEAVRREAASRGMSADELQTIYRIGSEPDEVHELQKKQAKLLREFDGYRTTVPKLAKEQGIPIAIDTARFYGVHPDEWADDVAYNFDLDQSDLYEEFFYPSDGATTW